MTTKQSRKNQENILFLLMGIIIISLAVAGFFLFQKQFYSFFKPKYTTNSSEIKSKQGSSSETESNTIKKPKEEEYIPQEDIQILQVYYGVKGKDKIECESKKVRKNSMLIGQARQVVNSLLEDPTNERLYKLLPDDLTLRGLFYDSGLYIIDFSREFSKIYTYGANEQILAVYSIVNSITELDPNAQVRFLINGREPDGEDGHLDLTAKLTRLDSIIEAKD